MKRKIAAIMAADVAGYNKLVAEDEGEMLRRLASYRAVFDNFIARASGRAFNTAEFPSAVEPCSRTCRPRLQPRSGLGQTHAAVAVGWRRGRWRS